MLNNSKAINYGVSPIQLDTDCEGPLSLNDNAFELCKDYIFPDGDRFFKQVSRYDDYLADILKKPNYKAGDTLKLILPFLKAFGITNSKILDYSRETIKLVPRVKETYKFLQDQNIPIFEINTSYQQFAQALMESLGFDTDNINLLGIGKKYLKKLLSAQAFEKNQSQSLKETIEWEPNHAYIYCTELDLDNYTLSENEARELKRLKNKIVAAPEIELTPEASSLKDLPEPIQEAISIFDHIFWEKIAAMNIGAIYRDISPIGGPEKARALIESLTITDIPLSRTIYAGDSITDVQALKLVMDGGGLSIAFNGNRYAINAAEIIVASDTAWPIALLTMLFWLHGKEGVVNIIREGRLFNLRKLDLPSEWLEPLEFGLSNTKFTAHVSDIALLEEAAKKSSEMRSYLRGTAIANLG
jgi:energy-converting hydrogenase A subunit R